MKYKIPIDFIAYEQSRDIDFKMKMIKSLYFRRLGDHIRADLLEFEAFKNKIEAANISKYSDVQRELLKRGCELEFKENVGGD